jgi:hypothetical protein
MEIEVEKKDKFIEIDEAIRLLEMEIRKFDNFITALHEGEIPSAGEGEDISNITFAMVYTNISNRIAGSTKRLAEMNRTLRDLIY